MTNGQLKSLRALTNDYSIVKLANPTCLNFGDCLVGVWRVFGNCLESVWRVSVGCLKGVLRGLEGA